MLIEVAETYSFSAVLLHVAMECYQMEVKTSWQANSERDERFTLHLEKNNMLNQYLLNKKKQNETKLR